MATGSCAGGTLVTWTPPQPPWDESVLVFAAGVVSGCVPPCATVVEGPGTATSACVKQSGSYSVYALRSGFESGDQCGSCWIGCGGKVIVP